MRTALTAPDAGDSAEPAALLLRQRYAAVFRSMVVVAALSYGSYFFLFLALGVPAMPWVNLFATGLCGVGGWTLARGHTRLALAVMAVVVLGHGIPATAVLGWSANFHLFAFLFVVFALLNPEFRLSTKAAISAAVTLGYLWLNQMSPPAEALPERTVAVFRTLNIVMFSGTVSYLALFYSSAMWGATERLGAVVAAERQARDNLASIFTSAPVALVLSRLKDGILIDGNARAVSLFETPLDETRGKPAPDFWVHPEDRGRLQKLVQVQGRADGFEAELQTRTGRRFWAELSASVVQVDGAPALLVGCTDVTSRRRADEALRRRESVVRTLLDAAPSPLIVTRLEDGVLQFANRPAAEMFGVSADEMVGLTAPTFYANAEDRRAFLHTLRQDGRVDGYSAQLRTRDGRVFWALLSARLFDLEGDPAMIVGLADVSAQKALEEQLRTLATTDALTGIFNRRHFLELAEAELARASRYGHPVSIAMLDLDHFKAINDSFGHGAGDGVLRGLVTLLRTKLRSVDVLGRIGGEEFALLLPETETAAAAATLERLRKAVEAHPFEGEAFADGRAVTVSIGLASVNKGESLTDVLQRADGALYGAKSAGRNRVVVAS